VPGFEPKIRVVARPPRRVGADLRGQALGVGARMGGDVVVLIGFLERRDRGDRVVEQPHEVGKASRKKPEMRTVTSTRGRPSSASGTISMPVTRLDSGCHVGRTPSSARISATSSPWVRIAAVPQATRPTIRGSSPVSAWWRSSSASASRRPTSHDSSEGRARGSTL
jgi:hypothetical protein